MSGRERVGSAILGVDLGEKRIGIAIATAGGPARPLVTVRRAGDLAGDVATLATLCHEHGVTELVVGLPLETISGDLGSQAASTRTWAEAIAAALAVPLTLRDERLSSRRAEERIGPPRRGRAGGPPSPAQRDAYRARVDREAAAIILQDELDARSRQQMETAT